jgi:exodeoxyribonuclease-3
VKIATWNVNSIRQREGHVQRWLEKTQPDVLFLQEIKCETPAFPSLPRAVHRGASRTARPAG